MHGVKGEEENGEARFQKLLEMLSEFSVHLKIYSKRRPAGPQQLWALAALPEDSGSVASTHQVAQTYMQASTHTYKSKSNK